MCSITGGLPAAGPLPGLTFIPGFPGMGGRKPGLLGDRNLGLLKRLGAMGPGGMAGGLGGGLGLGGGGLGSAAGGGTSAAAAAGAFGLASYVVTGTDPVAIALRQLSIVAIEAYGTAVQNSIKRYVDQVYGACRTPWLLTHIYFWPLVLAAMELCPASARAMQLHESAEPLAVPSHAVPCTVGCLSTPASHAPLFLQPIRPFPCPLPARTPSDSWLIPPALRAATPSHMPKHHAVHDPHEL